MYQEHTSVPLYGGISPLSWIHPTYSCSRSEQLFFKTSPLALVFPNSKVCLSTAVLKVADVAIGH